jgi:hypothetical protein
MASRSNIRPMPSPKGTNREGLYLRTSVLTRGQLLAFDAAGGLGEGQGNSDAMQEMRGDIERLLGSLDLDEKQFGKILEILDQHAPFDRIADDDPNAERARELAGDDDEDDPLAAVKKLLREKGLSETDIAEALRIAAEGGKATAKDSLPGMGGKFADRWPRMDEARQASLEAELDREFGTGRIVGEPIRQAADRRTVADDSDAAMARFAKMFPGAERIGHA